MRQRLQEVIDRMNEEAETVPGGHLWKLKKQIRGVENEIDEEIEKKKEEIVKVREKYALEMDSKLLKEQEREYEELEKEIDKLIEGIGIAEEMKSVLDWKKKEQEEMEMENAKSGQLAIQPEWEREAALFRYEYKEVQDKFDPLRDSNKSLLEKLEKVRGGQI